jgi:hypothetical protein
MTDLIAHDFIATETSRDEHKVAYQVRGQVTCPTTGFSIELEPINEGVVPTPDSALLGMKVTVPAGTVHETVTEVDVIYDGEDELELQHVNLRLGSVRTESGENAIALLVWKG